jgi:ferredoxin--NADP+ reductase
VSPVGTPDHPLRVAIIGAGPSGFFAAAALLGQREVAVKVDLYDILPTPFGLVRFGVAPDHARIKAVTRTYDKTAADPRFRFVGNVGLGRDVSREELLSHYHQVLYTVGAQADRRLGVPGEDLDGSFSATEFVAWYNGHPDYAHRTFDLSARSVAVVGVGNVAMDVARILAKTPDELRSTDIAEHALEALAASRVTDIHILARRGPAQAKFTNPEVKEFGEIANADPLVDAAELELDPVSARLADEDKTVGRNVEILREFAARAQTGAPRRVHFRFCVSPVALVGEGGRVAAVRLQSNELRPNAAGTDVSAVGVERYEELPVDLVFRSVGYKGVPLPGVPFDAKAGVIPNVSGRVVVSPGGEISPREYVAGWIKRGPSGVIGTNKPDAVESVEAMLADRSALPGTGADAAVDLVSTLEARGVRVVSFDDWRKLDRIEVESGAATGRPRVKLVSTADMLSRL